MGDYVTWSRGGKVFVTHKIIEIQNENYIVTSQTDYFADEGEIVNPDAPITYKNIYGKVIFSIPLLGDIFLGIKNLILINNSINIIGLLNIVLTVVTYYLFKKLLHVETYILKGY